MANKIIIVGSLAYSLRNFRGDLIKGMLERHNSVIAVAPDIENDKLTKSWLLDNGVSFSEVPLSRTGLSPAQDLLTLFSLIKLMFKFKPDFFLGYTIKPLVWGVIAAWIVRVPNRTALITGLGYAFTGKARGKRAFIQRIAQMLYRFSLKRATLIFFQNPDDKEDFKKLNLLPAGVPVVVVNGSGVNIRKYVPAPFPDSPMRFLMIARLLGDKGVREYVKAAESIRINKPEIEFHLVGGLDPNPDGISEDEVRSWCEAGHIVWHGSLGDVRPAIENSHVYVLPSYREGTPRTILEAMAMGRPVITTDVPGCRETVTHGRNGYLVASRSVEGLVEAMIEFIECPQLIRNMGEASRSIVEEKYDVNKVNSVMLKEMGLE